MAASVTVTTPQATTVQAILQFLLDGYKPADIAKALGITSKRVTEEKSRFIKAAKAHFHYALAA